MPAPHHMQIPCFIARAACLLTSILSLPFLNQSMEKARQKAWQDFHIKMNNLTKGDLVILYDSKYLKNPGKL